MTDLLFVCRCMRLRLHPVHRVWLHCLFLPHVRLLTLVRRRADPPQRSTWEQQILRTTFLQVPCWRMCFPGCIISSGWLQARKVDECSQSPSFKVRLQQLRDDSCFSLGTPCSGGFTHTTSSNGVSCTSPRHDKNIISWNTVSGNSRPCMPPFWRQCNRLETVNVSWDFSVI